MKAPRGDATKGGQVRHEQVMDTITSEVDSSNIRFIKQTQPCIFKVGGKRLEQYIQRNTTAEVQKSFALVIFIKCIVTDKMGIIEATEVSSKFTGFSGEVIRRWAMNIFAKLF